MTAQIHPQPFATLHRRRQTALKFALCAAPFVGALCFSPAQAATLQPKTFTGFVDPIQPASWTPSGSGNSSIAFRYVGSTGQNTQVLNLTSAPGQTSARSFNTAKFNAFAPTSSTPGKYFVFDSGVLKYSTSQFYAGGSFTPGSGPQSLAPSQEFKFELASLGTLADIDIYDISVDAIYKEVPGPLPVAAAVGAFAWSRRIRRRLNSATQA